MYDEFKYPLPEKEEHTRKGMVRKKIKLVLGEEGLTVSGPVSVDTLGLWDTVEALGVPNWLSRLLDKAAIEQHIVDIDGPNKRYGDQLCNVKHAYQALSIDDDREWIFTPLPLSRKYLFAHCDSDGKHLLDYQGKIIPERFSEVWFSGAHSDVGGGYPDSRLSGVILNWMIGNLKQTGLLPAGASVPEDPFGTSHDPEAGWWGPLYHAVNRDIATYVTGQGQRHLDFGNTLCVHPSVLKRRQIGLLREHEYHLLSLRAAKAVQLVPAKTDTPVGWKPRLREATADEQLSVPALRLEVQVWPHCMGMKGRS